MSEEARGTRDEARAARRPPTASLRRMLGGYFHQDFVAEYGGADAAARAYAKEAAADERMRAARQLRDLVESRDIETVRKEFARLRSGWRPRSAAQVREVLAILESETT